MRPLCSAGVVRPNQLLLSGRAATIAFVTVVKTLVCLANSRKGNGYCFAGWDVDADEWIRPVGAGWEGAVLAAEQRFSDGSSPALLDIVQVPLAKPSPEPGQPENWRLSDGVWKLVDRLSASDADALLAELKTDDLLFGTYGKAVDPATMQGLSESLAIVRPSKITWTKPSANKLRAVFKHSGQLLDLSVSDPAWIANFKTDAPGDYSWREDWRNYLTASITVEPWHGAHWKLVAGVISLQV